ncbi:MAG: FliM/FliN family flagellar motor switch protein [Candidatus Eisenbacteria sp.]|nr:FliM/FliN family flagellar motor switch protein [Candidatus Eisenbacteria bacterium]
MATAESSGRSPEVRPYDFRNPERLTTGVRSKLGAHQASLAEILSGRLSEGLRTESTVEFQEIREANAGVFLEPPHDPVFSLTPSSTSGDVLVRMESGLAQAFVELLLGGQGEKREPDREASSIEIALLGWMAGVVQASLGQAWPGGEGRAGEPAYLTSEERAELQGRGGVISSMGLTFGETTGVLRFFYGSEQLAGIVGGALGDVDSGAEAVGGVTKMTAEMIGGVALPVRVQMPPTPVQIQDLTSLEVGDVLYLDRKLDDEIRIIIGERHAFNGYPGTADGVLGVQISKPL